MKPSHKTYAREIEYKKRNYLKKNKVPGGSIRENMVNIINIITFAPLYFHYTSKYETLHSH